MAHYNRARRVTLSRTADSLERTITAHGRGFDLPEAQRHCNTPRARDASPPCQDLRQGVGLR
jgi:hypothetical protein